MAAPKPFPTLEGHVWQSNGRYKLGGTRANERCLPSHYVLAIVVAEACEWKENLGANARFTLRDIPAASAGFVCLRASMSANKQVRVAICIYSEHLS